MISTDTDEEGIMHSTSDNIEIMVNDKTDKVIKNFLNHFFQVIK